MPVLKNTLAYNAETKQVIKPVGMRQAFANAVEYDPVRDKGKLVCIHCKQARMTHRDKKDAIGGGNVFGWNAHFATIGSREPKKEKRDQAGNVIPYLPNIHADHCVATVVKSEHESEINVTKGYKIYVDMGYIKRIFRNNASPISRDPQTRRIVINDPDLADRERVTLKSPKDFITALKNLDAERLNQAVVIFENQQYTWQELFVRAESRKGGTPNIRWEHLAANILQGRDMPVFAHMSLRGKDAMVISDPRDGESLRFLLGEVVVEKASERRPVTVQYWLNVRNEHMFDMVRNSEGQEFIALVRPDGYPDSKYRGLFHVDLTVRDPKRLVEADLRAITLAVRQKVDSAAPPAPPAVA